MLAGLLAAGTGWYYWRLRETVSPPTIDLAGADPEVGAAIASADDAVRQSPRSVAAWGKLGEVLSAHYYDNEARVCFIRANQLDPKDARWPYLTGLTFLSSDTDAAISQYQRAVQLQSDSPAMRLRLAEALLSQDRLEEAADQFRELLALEPLNPRAQLGLGRLAYMRGDLTASREHLGRAAGSPLTQKASHILLAEIEQRANDPVAAARERYRAAELPDDQNWYDPVVDEVEQLRTGRQARLNRALMLLRREGLAAGLGYLRDLLNEYPDWDQAWLSYGRAYLEAKHYPDAESALRRALKAAPDSVQAHFYLGLTLFLRGDYAGAVGSFREATRLKPDHALAYYNLGHCWKRLGNQQKAIEAFREGLRCKP
ncbi:MAG TPA: tetratricopeptide repeat protein, partial [Pirellulales bacterium]|nr:tetratricopeptide repeat protein [Pirellulales bacterium]